MDTARNSYAIVEVLNRSSFACVVCLKKLETPPIQLACGCTLMSHIECTPSVCPNCKKTSFCLSRNQKYDKILACGIVTIFGLVCIAILLLILKFKFNML